MKRDDLDELFVTARTQRVEPSADLMARILADAEALQPKPAPVTAPPRVGFWQNLRATLGQAGVAGLASATLAGVWIGYAQPVSLDAFSVQDAPLDLVELIPSFDELLNEG